MISIITPTYNSEAYLEKCILSIMNQSISDYEHIIIDGGSTDSTIEIIQKYENAYNMKWISEKDKDRKSTRLNSSHRCISYAVFCLKKKNYRAIKFAEGELTEEEYASYREERRAWREVIFFF